MPVTESLFDKMFETLEEIRDILKEKLD